MLPGVEFRLQNGRLVADADHPLTDDERAYIRDHKPAIIAELERRRRRDEVLMMLSDQPGVRCAYTVDASADPVIVAVGIRDLATCELSIPAERYDPWKLAALMGGEVET